jgi:3-hydroxyisobutyrate dehydrogenase-like beta-hydroxyacid dehydrogenase
VNLLLLDGVMALAESFTAGRSGGLSDDQLRELLGQSPVVAPAIKNRFEGVLTGQQEPWWTAALGAKDARLAVELVTGVGGDLPVIATARDQYQKAAELSPGEDIAAVAKIYRR